MGAEFTEQVAAGKTIDEAYQRAVADAAAEYGHQEGYSGAINSKGHGYSFVELPARFTYQKLLALISDYYDATSALSEARDEVRDYSPSGFFGRSATTRSQKAQNARSLRKAQADLKRAEKAFARVEARIPAALAYRFDGIAETANDKWREPLAVEITGAERAKYGYVSRRRGERLFIFFGYAPS